jgi:hypothetical protein
MREVLSALSAPGIQKIAFSIAFISAFPKSRSAAALPARTKGTVDSRVEG